MSLPLEVSFCRKSIYIIKPTPCIAEINFHEKRSLFMHRKLFLPEVNFQLKISHATWMLAPPEVRVLIPNRMRSRTRNTEEGVLSRMNAKTRAIGENGRGTIFPRKSRALPIESKICTLQTKLNNLKRKTQCSK